MLTKKIDFISNFFKVLNINKIDYFVLGEYHCLPENTGDSDLDVIVIYKEIDLFITILSQLLKEYKVLIVSFYKNDNAYFYRLIGRSDSYWGLQMDLFYKGFYYQNKEYYPINDIKKNVLLYKRIKVLDLKKAYFIGFLKEIIHKGWAKEKYLDGFISEIISNKETYNELFKNMYGSDFTNIVFNNLSKKKLKSKTELLNNVMRKKLFGHFFFLINLIYKIKNLNRIFHKPGYTIVFLGTDGSGKSTIIEQVKPILNEAFHNSVYYEHLRPNLIPSISRLLGNKESFDGPVTDPHAKKPSGFWGSLLRFNYYLIDYTFGYWFKIFPKKAFHSCVWIFDRYYYDYLIDPYRLRVSLPKFLFNLFQYLIPKPDLILCLGTSPEIIYKRKPELTLEEVKKQVEDLSLFCKKHKNSIWIDTGNSIEQSVNESMEAISKMMKKRFQSFNS